MKRIVACAAAALPAASAAFMPLANTFAEGTVMRSQNLHRNGQKPV